jgi:peptidoglycan/LPS O-acetylase OafA/YrhL
VALYHEHVIPWTQSGNFAVQVFFALSGWLIGSILLHTDLHGLPKFYYKRATRIWIPYALAVAVLYGLAAFREGIDETWLRCLFFDGTFTHNWFINPMHPMPLHGTGNHFWSIAVEEQFYLAAPLLLVLLPFGRSITFWSGVAIVAVLSSSWYGSISLGVLAAVIRSRHGDWQLAKTATVLIASAAVLLTIAIATLEGFYDWIAPPLALSIVLLASRQGHRTRLGEFAGGISYPMYLYHWIGAFAAGLLLNHAGVRLPAAVIAFPVALCMGAAAYLAIDWNVMRWRGSAYRPRLGKVATVTAYVLLSIGTIGGMAYAL